ncbi:MAG: fibro-slime domain-containing protein, partial [Planctomycetota bacterium]
VMSMQTRNSTAIVTCVFLLALGLRVLYSEQFTPRESSAAMSSSPTEISISGIIHDFAPTHPDFGVVPVGGYGHYAGNIAATLDSTPEFIGLGADAFAVLPPPVPTFEGPWGYETAFANTVDDEKDKQFAVQLNLTGAVIVKSITAYVGMNDKDVRYAIYTDNAGEPDALIVQSAKAESEEDSMAWLSIPISDTYLDAGTYWLALALEDNDQRYAYVNSGGNARVRSNDAVDDGYVSSWGTSTETTARRLSIYASTISAAGMTQIGQTSPLSTNKDNVDDKQIAVPIVMPEDGTILSISAYVGEEDRDTRFALYTNDGNKPGTLLAETAKEETQNNGLGWLTLYIDDTDVTAGTYWIAMVLEDNDQTITVTSSGGTTHYRNHSDAADDGFYSSWGSSNSTTAERVAMYATYTTDVPDVIYPGFKVTDEWRDAVGRAISPQMEGLGADAVVDFEIVEDTVIPDENFAIEVRVLGGAIQSGSTGYHVPVTMQVGVGSGYAAPFGPYNDAVNGNLNDDQGVTCNSNGTNPRCAVIPGPFSPGTPVNVHCRSWGLEGIDGCLPASWDVNMEVNSDDNTNQVAVLRDGDPVPSIPALYNQASIADYIEDYVDLGTNTMNLGVNQIIYLFEVGSSGGSSSADFQDLVVLVTLANNATGLCGSSGSGSGTSLCGTAFGDTTGTAIPAGTIDASGGISSAASFSEWFTAVPSVNLSLLHTITLVDDGTGVYEYITPDFTPIDGAGLGNFGASFNHFFTYNFKADFIYQSCGGQFIEFAGSDDAWLFVNDRLVMDRGGILPLSAQYVDMDRLGLTPGEAVTVDFFYAQRQTSDAAFELRTNIPLETKGMVTVTDLFD